MTCEKQFLPHDDKFLYCSEPCRRLDQQSSSSSSTSTLHNYTPSYDLDHHSPRDIIPQASPSRPNSTLFSTSPTTNSHHTSYSYHHESAVSALRSSLGAARPPSPGSPSGTSIWPFRRSSAATSDSSSSYYKTSTYDPTYYERPPLPSRQPVGYSRSKSIELVTPILTR